MPEFLEHHPGLLYVVATLLPLASFVVLLLTGMVRHFTRKAPEGTLGASLHRALGGDTPGRGAAYVATAAIGLAFVCSLLGFIQFVSTHGEHASKVEARKEKLRELYDEQSHMRPEARQTPKQKERRKQVPQEIARTKEELATLEGEWSGRVYWAGVGAKDNDKRPGTALYLGYRIDHLTVIMFLMVTLIAMLIHVFSIGYMKDETQETVEDHEVHVGHHHLRRRGRFGQFFMYLSLFCFSMLNLVLADNLFQVFVSWELVGICSYLLIGFYYERHSASTAANKAFITNRVGDAGFIIGLLIIWTYLGTFNFEEIFQRVRAPMRDSHGDVMDRAAQIMRAKAAPSGTKEYTHVVTEPGQGEYAVLFPRNLEEEHFLGLDTGSEIHVNPEPDSRAAHGPRYAVMPYWLLVAAGLGVFMGCVGKSAQFPLQVWLPDAMAGPTPVSALIHAATMVAAGVYLVGRVFPLFTPEALLVIAYTGAITLFVAATIALVMTDIKKVLAYSTVSQLGFMMLALGVGGWVAGLFHLITHAFFKALLFLCSGSVIYGCHHEQEMTKMGGLYPKMKITALTMLIGCLAIAGTPLFSGWYSKDTIIASAFGFGLVHTQHILLFVLPVLTAGITTFYMFRMWFMTFTGKPRDAHVYEHAHESPATMTVPLIILALFSVVVAWGWPLWDPEASVLEHQIHHAMPRSVQADFGVEPMVDKRWSEEQKRYVLDWTGGPTKAPAENARHQAHSNHLLAGNMALGMALIGFVFAYLVYYRGVLDPADAKEQFPGLYRFLWNKWYFDELYSALLVRPALTVANWCRGFDSKVIDGVIHTTARGTVRVAKDSGWVDLRIVDGLVNLLARTFYGLGSLLRGVQTGYLRSYVVFLVVAAIAIWVLLAALLGAPAATTK